MLIDPRDIVDVQPMTQPSGLVFTLRCSFSGDGVWASPETSESPEITDEEYIESISIESFLAGLKEI
jgi:hypothetical protein